MLRVLVLLLALANAGYFAWSQNLLADYGFAPQAQSEPQRLTQQLRPEALQLITRDSPLQPEPPAGASLAAPPGPVQCLQAGPFSDEQAKALRTGLETSLPDGSWALQGSLEPGRWIIYMGRYASEEALAKKRNELRNRNVSFESLVNPALKPGLSLGHFNSQAEAEAELSRINQRGVRTARVLQERPEVRGHTLTLAAADAPLLARLDALQALLAGKALQACP